MRSERVFVFAALLGLAATHVRGQLFSGNVRLLPSLDTIPTGMAYRVVVAELNGDTLPDLLWYAPNDLDGFVYSDYADSIGWFEQIAPGVFDSVTQWVTTENGAEDVIVADFNGDLAMDVVTLSPTTSPSSVRFGIYWNNGSGIFSAVDEIDTVLSDPWAMDAGDLDMDGDLDLVVHWNGVPNDSIGPRWYLNDGSGQFTVHGVSQNMWGQGVLVSDLAGDPAPDIAVYGQTGAWFFVNDGSGEFGQGQVSTEFGLYWTDAADIDGDGLNDLITSGVSAGEGPRLSLNEGMGAFGQQTEVCAPLYPDQRSQQWLDGADMDLNGWPDVVALFKWDCFGSGGDDTCRNILTALNLGYGTFAPTEHDQVNVSVRGIALGDVDLDGDADVVVVTVAGLRVFENLAWSNYRIEGYRFHDVNGDGIRNAGDHAIPGASLTMLPDQLYGLAVDSGHFTFITVPGTHTVAAAVPMYWQLTTPWPNYTVELTTNTPVVDSLVFGLEPVLDTLLVQPGLSHSSSFRCESPFNLWLSTANIGTLPADGLIDVEFHPGYSGISAVPPADSIVGLHYYWSFNHLMALNSWSIDIQATAPNVSYLGDTVPVDVVVLATDTLGGLQMQSESHWHPVLSCSYDPNDKLVDPVGRGVFGAVDMSTDHFDYTVRFQNTGTASALDVVISDQLDDALEPSSIAIVDASHPLTSAQVDTSGRLTFRFEGINLPDSGADQLGSQGFVKFRVGVLPGLPSSKTIRNRASIYFDLNPPVITNTVLNTLIDCDLYTSTITYLGVDLLQASEGESYQWYLDGLPISGATSQELLVPGNGSYTVEVTNEYGCVSVSDGFPVIGMAVETSAVLQMALIPNPARDHVRLIASEPIMPDHIISICDVHGRVLREFVGNGTREVIIDIGDLSPGLYVVQLRQKDGGAAVCRLVIE